VNATIVHSERANVVQNAARRFLDPTVSPQGQLEREVMYLQQICGDLKSKVGAREVIEKFSIKPVKPDFVTPEVKASIIENPENFSKMAYVVDGRVDTMEGKPTLYKITVVRDAFDRPLGAGAAQWGLAPNTGTTMPLTFPNSTAASPRNIVSENACCGAGSLRLAPWPTRRQHDRKSH
jgi:hypothetical protein